MKHPLLLATLMLTSTTALAQASITQSPAYQECTTLASGNPALALDKAEAWLKIDTSIAAQHCHAMALYGLRRFGEAGDALSAVRDNIETSNVALRSYITRQAARAWLNAAQVDKSLALLSTQLTELGSVRGDNATTAKLTAELLLDRARLNINYGKLNDAAKDLHHAVSLTPINEEVLLERAGVFEKLGDQNLARSDAEIVLKLNSKNSAAKEMLSRLGAPQAPAANLAAPVAAASADTALAAPVTAVTETAAQAPAATNAPSPFTAPKAAPRNTKKPVKTVTKVVEAP